MSDPRLVEAPEVLVSLSVACESVRRAVDPHLLELARLRLATLLGNEAELAARPWGDATNVQRDEIVLWPTSGAFDDRDRAALALAEQFAIDVTGVLPGPLGAAFGALGEQLGPFVQALYLLDVGQRVATILSGLLDITITSDDWAWADGGQEIPADPMDAIMAMLAATGRLQRVDPVVKELVRLRGARLHQCRRCLSVRSVAAIGAGADESLLGAEDPASVADLPAGTRAALDLVDSTFTGQPMIDRDLRGRLTGSFDGTELVELVSYLMRNACNKIPVAFGVDDAIVDEGFEFQIIDAMGETVTVDGPSPS